MLSIAPDTAESGFGTVSAGVVTSGGVSSMHWKSLRYFNIYRLVLAGILFVSSIVYPATLSILSPNYTALHYAVTGIYVLAAAASLVVLHYVPRRFNRQLSISVLVDVAVLTLLMYSGGGLRSGLGAMMLVTLAGSGLVGQGRLVLFYAAMATIAVLLEQSYRSITTDLEVVDFFQAGLYCAGFFGIAISARLLARRVIANEELARKRGIELKNQTVISQRVIEEMQDGVLVLNRSGWVKQHNPRAKQLLGLGNPTERQLASYSTELARGFSDWRDHGTKESVLVRAPASGMQLRARFVATDSVDKDVLIFLEDTGSLQEQARQLKLAALGRLTANIAHEIRNPLSAINHAGELLREESHDPTNERLVRIVLDNAQRVQRIVSDVLEVGRRDRAHRERIDLRSILPALVEEITAKEKISEGVVQFDFEGVASLCFDRSHFHQVMWNLVGNALRYSRREVGSIRLLVRDARDAWVELHVIDDGEGVGEDYREQIFEPFFTTHSRGTGLGLYIARELCDANGARLTLLDSESGTDFCITGRSVE